MARSGVYKSEVRQARDSLLAQGRIHPSTPCASRSGNTGSKTTIHKYLKELEEDDGGVDDHKASIGEALQDLVGRLAAQLKEEANHRVDQILAQGADKDKRHAETTAALRQEVAALSDNLQRAEATALQERSAHEHISEELQNEKIIRHTLERQVIDLKERLAENDAHRQSIEEKHQHARDALEHYRQSVKEQRDQDQRRMSSRSSRCRLRCVNCNRV